MLKRNNIEDAGKLPVGIRQLRDIRDLQSCSGAPTAERLLAQRNGRWREIDAARIKPLAGYDPKIGASPTPKLQDLDLGTLFHWNAKELRRQESDKLLVGVAALKLQSTGLIRGLNQLFGIQTVAQSSRLQTGQAGQRF
jgi:hypothetical protein